MAETKTRAPKRMLPGVPIAEIPLEAVKSYPIKIWDGLFTYPRIAYADWNTHHENNVLGIKLLPFGGKTAPHPQLVLYVHGPYHVETLTYHQSDPNKWTTWIELHLDSQNLRALIEALMRIERLMHLASLKELGAKD